MKHKTLIGLSILLLIILAPASFSLTYNEKITKPSMTDNSYSIAVSNFIKEKCGNCKDVMIIGDDFVVPGYRNYVPISEGISMLGIVDWFEDRINVPIYTDSSYIQRKLSHKISDIDQLEENVYFILPDNLDEELLLKIRNLENTLKGKFEAITIHEKYGNEINCNDVQYFDSFNDASLFIIGDRENNPSLKCYPFIQLEENMLTIQPNIWDTAYLFDDSKSFTVILSTINSTVIENFDYILSTGLYADVQTESAIIDYTLMVAGVAGTGAVIIGAVAVGSPTLIIGGVALATVSIANECVINNAGGDNWGWCGVGATLDLVGGQILHLGFKAAKPIVKWTVKNTIGKVGINLIGKHGNNFLQFTYNLIKNGKYKSFINALSMGSKYPDDVYQHVLKSAYSKTEIDKLAKYQKFLGSNPFNNIDSTKNLQRIYDSQHSKILIRGRNIDDSAYLVKGDLSQGWEHIKYRHIGPDAQIQPPFPLSLSESDIMDLIGEGLIEGTIGISNKPGINKVIEFTPAGWSKVLRIVIRESDGYIITAFPVN